MSEEPRPQPQDHAERTASISGNTNTGGNPLPEDDELASGQDYAADQRQAEFIAGEMFEDFSDGDDADDADTGLGEIPATAAVLDVRSLEIMRTEQKAISEGGTYAALEVAHIILACRLTRQTFPIIRCSSFVPNSMRDTCPSVPQTVLMNVEKLVAKAMKSGSQLFADSCFPLRNMLRFWMLNPATRACIDARHHECASAYTSILDGHLSIEDIRAIKFPVYREKWQSVRWYESVLLIRETVRSFMQLHPYVTEFRFVHLMFFHDFFKAYRHRLLQLGVFSTTLLEVPTTDRASASSAAKLPYTVINPPDSLAQAISATLRNIRIELDALQKEPLLFRDSEGRITALFPIYFCFLADAKARNDLAGWKSAGLCSHPCTMCPLHVDQMMDALQNATNPPLRSEDQTFLQLMRTCIRDGNVQDPVAADMVRRLYSVSLESELFRFPNTSSDRALETFAFDPLHLEGSNDFQKVVRGLANMVQHAIPNFFARWSRALSSYPFIFAGQKPHTFSTLGHWLSHLTATEKMTCSRVALATLYGVFKEHFSAFPELIEVWEKLCDYCEYSKTLFCRTITLDDLESGHIRGIIRQSRIALRYFNSANDAEARLNAHSPYHLPYLIEQLGSPMSSYGGADENMCLVLRTMIERHSNGRKIETSCLKRWVLSSLVKFCMNPEATCTSAVSVFPNGTVTWHGVLLRKEFVVNENVVVSFRNRGVIGFVDSIDTVSSEVSVTCVCTSSTEDRHLRSRLISTNIVGVQLFKLDDIEEVGECIRSVEFPQRRVLYRWL